MHQVKCCLTSLSGPKIQRPASNRRYWGIYFFIFINTPLTGLVHRRLWGMPIGEFWIIRVRCTFLKLTLQVNSSISKGYPISVPKLVGTPFSFPPGLSICKDYCNPPNMLLLTLHGVWEDVLAHRMLR
jgi:hypothetical protein